jgi:hypothetical protein
MFADSGKLVHAVDKELELAFSIAGSCKKSLDLAEFSQFLRAFHTSQVPELPFQHFISILKISSKSS